MISMTNNGDPLENAIAERMNGILKSELISSYYNTIDEASVHISIIATVRVMKADNLKMFLVLIIFMELNITSKL